MRQLLGLAYRCCTFALLLGIRSKRWLLAAKDVLLSKKVSLVHVAFPYHKPSCVRS